MVLGQHRYTVCTFTNRLDAERALNTLKHSGFPTDEMAIVSDRAEQSDRNQEIGEVRSNNIDEEDSLEEKRAMAGALVGSLIGAIGGSLLGLGLVLVPEADLVATVGSWGTPLIATVAGGGIGAASCGLIGALAGTEIAEDERA